MRDLERRLLQLEQAISLAKCLCSQRIVVLLGDPEPVRRTCPQHGRSRVIRWPLARSRLDTGATGQAIGSDPAMATVGAIYRPEDGSG